MRKLCSEGPKHRATTLLLDFQPRGQMGSIGETDETKPPIRVLVTGFGPFQERYPVNPSYEITRLLPEILPKTTSDGRSVRIVGYDHPIRVCYEEVQELVPVLLESVKDTIDLVLHIGMSSGRDFYTAEVYAHRDGYSKNKDLDGEALPGDYGLIHFGDCPSIMTTSLDCDQLARLWKSNLRDIPEGSPGLGADCRLSEDAGHYLCDFIYYNSLAWFGRRNECLDGGKVEDRPVMFLHVPAESHPAMLEKGRQVAIALIAAMVDNWCSSSESERPQGIW